MIFGITSLSLSRTIKIGYVEFPPMTYTDDQGRPAGVIIDITSKTLKRAGYQWTAMSLPAKRMAKMLTTGDIQLWIGLSTLPEFKGKTHVGKSVVKKLVFRAYTMGKSKPILNRDDLFGQTVLILRGYSYGGRINYIKNPSNQVKFIEFDSHEGAFKGLTLLSKRVQSCFLLNYKHPSEIVFKSGQYRNIQYNDISSFDIHFVVTRKMENAKTFLFNIENAFLQLKQDI